MRRNLRARPAARTSPPWGGARGGKIPFCDVGFRTPAALFTHSNFKRAENRKGFDRFCHAVLIAGVVVLLFPVYVGFCAATMSAQEVFTVPLSLIPSTHLFENIATIWHRGSGATVTPFGILLINSLVMALVIALGKIAVSILSAYAIVYFRFAFRNTAFWLIFVTLMLPVEVRIFPTVQVVSTLGMTN
ncbi:MAG: hypothetical protein GAK41_01516 [Burkholderia gladioli]|nr:MAG: hypothetical protein GAK41_01516 [Burkholderia gladioli]